MARGFASASSQKLNAAFTHINEPFTIACRFFPTNDGATEAMITISDSADTDVQHGLLIRGAVANDPLSCFSRSSSPIRESLADGVNFNAWNSAVGVWPSDASRTAYLNGVAATPETTSVAISTIDDVSIGVLGDSSPAAFFNGRIADVAIWTVTLTALEIVSYDEGNSPAGIRPASLINHWELIRDEDQDRILGGVDLTATNAPTIEDHPPIFFIPPLSFVAAPTATSDTVTLTQPTAYETYQRTGSTGSIAISGTYTGTPTAIEADFNGGGYATIDASPTGGTFSGTLSSQAQGQGTLTVRFTNDTGVTDTATNVGIGDIYIIAGQSNMSGRATNNQSYSHGSLSAALFGNDDTWKDLTDPYDDNTGQVDAISSDPLAAGSIVPLLATDLMAKYEVPVAFVPCANSGDTINDWQDPGDPLDGSTLFGSMERRWSLLSSGAKAVLFWQGESDALNGTVEATYNSDLDQLASDISTHLGIPFYVAIIGPRDDGDPGNLAAIRSAQYTAWADNANVTRGASYADQDWVHDVHATTDAEITLCAHRFVRAILNIPLKQTTRRGVGRGVGRGV